MKQLITSIFIFLLLYQVANCQSVGSIVQIKKIGALQGNLPLNTIQAGDHFGCSIDTIGDVNNDGILDIVVGAFQDDDGGTNRGAVYVLFMDTNRTVKSFQKISSTQGLFISNGLSNGDGFGYRVAGIGDINNDGTNDIAVGAAFSDVGGTDRGSVYIIFLNRNGTVKSHQVINNNYGYLTGGLPLNNNDWFSCVSKVGDIDHDGVNDIAVGSSQDDGGTGNSYQKGAIYILKLLPSGKVKSYTKIQNGDTNFTNTINNGDRLGISVTNIGDINNDSIPDIAVGAFRDDNGGNNNGAVYVILLDSTGNVDSYSKISNSSFTNSPLYGEFGVSVSSVPDFDGNGTIDLLIGAYTQNTYTGGAYLVNIDSLGSAISYNYYSGSSFGNNSNNDRLGWGISRWANINNNAYIEVCLGAARDDDGGTSAGALYIASIKPYLSIPISSIEPLCFGDSNGVIVTTGSGINPPFTYLWNNGSTNDTLFGVSAGSYTVTLTDSLGNSITKNIWVGQPSPLFLSTSPNSMLCLYDSINISALCTGGVGTKTYHWSSGLSDSSSHFVTPLFDTNYFVYSTDSNYCSSDTNQISLTVNPLPEPNLGNDTSIYSGSITISPGNFIFYQWNTGSYAPSLTINSNTTNGNHIYSVYVEDQNGCGASDTIIINITTGLSENSQYINISTFPNPTHNILYLEWQEDVKLQKIDIYDSFGKLVQSSAITTNSSQMQVNFKEFEAGSYFIRLQGDELVKVVKVIVE